MNRAWVLVNTVVGKERQALAELRLIPGVKEAFIVTGQYDLIMLLEAKNMKQLQDIISWNIRRHRTVCNTVTMIVA